MNPTSDDLYRHLYQSLAVVLIATDADLKIRAWNQAAARLFGASAEQMLDTPLVNAVPAERRPLIQRLFERALEQHESSDFETPFLDPQGHERYLAVTISPIIDERDNRCTGICAAVRDISRLVALEKQIASNRTMTALGHISGSVAHHFNNLLGGIATSVDFAQAMSNPSAMKRALQQTADLVARASKITQSLLTFAEGDPQQEPVVPFEEVVRQAIDAHQKVCDEKKIHLNTTLQAIPMIPAPVKRARTLLQNLIDNAIEAMPEGGELKIELIHFSEFIVKLVIQDSGHGISPDAMTHLYEPFFTTKGTLAGGQADHFGLGLAVAHGIVRGMDGTITVSSPESGGTSFEISLPIPEQQ